MQRNCKADGLPNAKCSRTLKSELAQPARCWGIMGRQGGVGASCSNWDNCCHCYALQGCNWQHSARAQHRKKRGNLHCDIKTLELLSLYNAVASVLLSMCLTIIKMIISARHCRFTVETVTLHFFFFCDALATFHCNHLMSWFSASSGFWAQLAAKSIFTPFRKEKKQSLSSFQISCCCCTGGTAPQIELLYIAATPHRRQPTKLKRFATLKEKPSMLLLVAGYHCYKTSSATFQNLLKKKCAIK